VTPAVEVRGLGYSYGQTRALSDVSFSVAPGERVGVAGANGSGKSTLLWCLLGLLPAKGEVRIFGRPLGRRPPRQAALVFQNPEDQLFMPALLDDVALGLLNRGEAPECARAKAREALRAVDLLELAGREASQLSLGQRKRAAIAVALAAAPELLLLDEPTAELDGRSVRHLASLLPSLPGTHIIATHHLEFLRAVTSRTLVLAEGTVIADGPTREILADRALLERSGLI
jgi:cobalt/nickel transport system ATP-binding protein